MEGYKTYIFFTALNAVSGIPSQVYQNNLSLGSQVPGLLYLHRVLVHDSSRPLKLKANNQEVPYNALVAKVKAMSFNLTSFDLQTFGTPSAPPAGSGYLLLGC